MIENILYGLIYFGLILIGIGVIGDILSVITSNSFIEFRGKTSHFVNFSNSGALIASASAIILLMSGKTSL